MHFTYIQKKYINITCNANCIPVAVLVMLLIRNPIFVLAAWLRLTVTLHLFPSLTLESDTDSVAVTPEIIYT